MRDNIKYRNSGDDQIYELKYFTYVKNEKVLVTEASDIDMKNVPTYITVLSKKSCIFKFIDVIKSDEEIAGWKYKSSQPEVFDGNLVIYND